MSKSAIVTTRLAPETLALVDRVASAQGRSRSWFTAKAIREAAGREAEYLAFVQEGIDAVDRGDVIPHEEMKIEIEGMIARHRARAR